jgi:nucleoside-diphosphate-sugar epimerase
MFEGSPVEGVNVNVMGFMNVMEASKRNKIKKIIFASSSSLYNGLPLRPYKGSHQFFQRLFTRLRFSVERSSQAHII